VENPVTITNYERVLVALRIQHAMRMRLIVVCGLPDSTIYKGWNFNSGNYLFTTDTK